MNLRNVIDALRAKTVDNGCTEDEAMAAALKVRELINKHGEPTEELEAHRRVGSLDSGSLRKLPGNAHSVQPVVRYLWKATWRIRRRTTYVCYIVGVD